MASKAMWEVDPETRSKLLAIQKESGNSLCCDCNAPSPQWASPKFGIFICLSCAGVHRGLGVHISFVRSISMDAFKQTEIERMRLGGNDHWKSFFDKHETTKMTGMSWDDATIAERYSGEVGEEWKERLSAKVEGREYVPGERKPTPAKTNTGSASRSATPLSGTANNNSSSGGRPESPSTSGGKAKVDDKYFEGLGAANAARPDNLPPSQGGKYAGFGNTPAPASQEEGLPKLDELQKDPLAALGKGLGWFTSTVTRTATSVNKDFIQPTAKQVGSSDFAAQAKVFGGRIGQSVQQGARSASENFNRFVEGQESGQGASRNAPLDESKKSFWDDFASLADQRKPQSSSIGTSAMGKGNSSTAKPPAAKKDEWDDW
ncbi:ADP-ribosylation factor GTPase-activating protein GCS1 [Diaporthe helianthi]|uniref:ADP-ribosylation factor GTPase-activating protein GCS1 n=1 Tax=Diaporthe helianthi TaxID=158607 RepID=A0A2P5IE04_DIAHE|nr:ADP-ribosylation factor GTPase-activating protein GCS1 [Diaporthe helianthi]